MQRIISAYIPNAKVGASIPLVGEGQGEADDPDWGRHGQVIVSVPDVVVGELSWNGLGASLLIGSVLLCHVSMIGSFDTWPPDPSTRAELGVEVAPHHGLPWKELELPVAGWTRSG